MDIKLFESTKTRPSGNDRKRRFFDRGRKRSDARGYQTKPASAFFSRPNIGPNMTTKGEPKLRIIPLGGQEEVGRNMTVFEYGQDIIILDMGLQFPEEDMPGVDYIIPDIRYLRGKEKNIRGIILSHGHLDHIGALPHLMPRLGWPTVYASKMTLALVRRRLEESKSERQLKSFEIKSVNERLRLGNFTLNFFDVTHSIMDALGVIIQTPEINIIHPGDWRYDLQPVSGKGTDFSHLARWNTNQTPALLMMESLGSTKEGHQMPEKTVYDNIKKLISSAPGRIIIATFSSMVERVAWIIEIAESMGKKVALDGYSMKANIEIAKQVGYVKFKPTTIIDIKKAKDYPDNKVVIVCTGAQGEDRAVLMRIANREHKHVKLQPSDTIVFSSSVIPGNERTIQRLKDSLYRQCGNVVHKEIMGVHSGGHAFIEDIKLLLKQIRPKYFFPVYANHYLLREGAKIAESIGFPKNNIFILDNGSVAEVTHQGIKVLPHKIPIEYVFVDGLGVGDVSQVVIRDRQILAGDGMLVIVATVDGKTGAAVGSPDIISRGFVYMKSNKRLVEETRSKVKQILKAESAKPAANDIYLKDKLKNDIGQFLYHKTQRRPMILPVIIEV